MQTRQARPLLLLAPAVAGGLATWWFVGDRSPTPESLAGWAFLSIWLLVCTAFVCVVLVGMQQTSSLMRTRQVSDREREDWRRRSTGVGQLIVAGTGLLAVVTLGVLAASA